jgi:hypothetical protein
MAKKTGVVTAVSGDSISVGSQVYAVKLKPEILES